MKQGRKFSIGDDVYTYFNCGVYGDIFVNSSRTRCWKLFKQRSDKAARDSFNSEIKAYELSKLHPDVENMVPNIYRKGELCIEVKDTNGNDVSTDYCSGLNYEMEFLDLRFKKIGCFLNESTEKIQQLFEDVGIYYTVDASLAYDSEGRPKLIDFGVDDIEIWH